MPKLMRLFLSVFASTSVFTILCCVAIFFGLQQGVAEGTFTIREFLIANAVSWCMAFAIVAWELGSILAYGGKYREKER
ncbi:hypothetical protein M4D58_23755 [Brevibacillus borstelensis]|uniref:hypothetical protein n=1 Tax=Brevibacillus borstelensis TaxID=45462 RepID=UPI00203D0BEC|nr:hypothetical protein [Brevibacillus borstelensis]MCM3593641.1 hypothetical protein [Brevibacillus borstelensis]